MVPDEVLAKMKSAPGGGTLAGGNDATEQSGRSSSFASTANAGVIDAEAIAEEVDGPSGQQAAARAPAQGFGTSSSD